MNNNKEFLPDYKVFEKSNEEKAKVHTIKKKWQSTMRMFYGDNWRKHNNPNKRY